MEARRAASSSSMCSMTSNAPDHVELPVVRNLRGVDLLEFDLSQP